MSQITLAHGEGTKQTTELIQQLFYEAFQNDILLQSLDANIMPINTPNIAVSTDSFVINPIIFEGGDIGKLSVCGTVNDVAMSGAIPMYLTVSFILEEGFSIETLKQVVNSIAKTAKEANVHIVAGDTKVVEANKGDQIYINTTGIGVFDDSTYPINGMTIQPGDCVILSGTIADHGMAILSQREFFELDPPIESDCAVLHELIQKMMNVSSHLKFLRDPTRGGLATTLHDIATMSYDLIIEKQKVPIKPYVRSFCRLLGIDPFYVANEGKLVCIVSKEDADTVLEVMRQHPLGTDAAIIGSVQDSQTQTVLIKTEIGGHYELNQSTQRQLPRIC